jgi:acyl transferase domain-containing protein/acyl carrier protein
MQSLPAGAMLAVHRPAAEVEPMLRGGLALAAVNAPSLCVVSGEAPEVEALETDLARRGVSVARLHTSHAFHSAMMDPILDRFRERVAAVRREPPRIPYVSNLTGAWITAEQATDPEYWVSHLRRTVRFEDGLRTLWAEPERILLEVGPGNALSTFARLQAPRTGAPAIVSSLRHPRDEESDRAFFLLGLGRLWMAGARVDAAPLFAGEQRRRVELPTYPFERQRYWIEAPKQPWGAARSASAKKDAAEWFYVPTWKSALPVRPLAPRNGAASTSRWLLFVDASGLGERLAERLRAAGDVVVTVRPGRGFSGGPRSGFEIDPGSPAAYERVLKALSEDGRRIDRIVHGWSVSPERTQELTADAVASAHDLGYYSVLHLARALAAAGGQPVQLKVLTSHAQAVLRGDRVHPERATLLGLAKVLPQEQHSVTVSCVDVDSPDGSLWQRPAALDALVEELRSDVPGAVVAHRNGQRFVQGFEPLTLPLPEPRPARLRDRGVYLITGGLGGVSCMLAAYLAHACKARLVLTGRGRLPARSEWSSWRETRGDADPVSIRIARVKALEELGAEVLVLSADVADEARMREAVREAEERFGPLDGVIHGAGLVSGNTFRPVQEIGAGESEEQFRPKVAGLMVLDRVLGDRKLDFCVLLSSLSSVLGGFAYGAYAAANLFMDAYVHARNERAKTAWLSVNWDEWRLVERRDDEGRRGLANFAMSAVEGASAFARLLDLSGISQVVVSTGDLGTRIDQWVRLEALRGVAAAPSAEPEHSRHPRPRLQNAYVAPGTPTEQKIARIWAELLGIEKVGTQDNFFDLGGHSLLAIQVVTRIKAELAAEISVATLFEGPTVESLSRLVTPEAESPAGFEHSSDRGRKRKEERLRRHAERMEGRP